MILLFSPFAALMKKHLNTPPFPSSTVSPENSPQPKTTYHAKCTTPLVQHGTTRTGCEDLVTTYTRMSHTRKHSCENPQIPRTSCHTTASSSSQFFFSTLLPLPPRHQLLLLCSRKMCNAQSFLLFVMSALSPLPTSSSALLLAFIFGFPVHSCKTCRPTRGAPALGDFLVS